MRRLFERIFDVSQFTGLVDRDRARLVYVISVLAFIGASLFMAITLAAPQAVFSDNFLDPNLFYLLFIFFFIGLIATIAVTRSGRSRGGSLMLILLITVSFGPLSLGSGADTSQDGMLLFILLVLSGLLLEEWGLILGVGIAVSIKTVALAILPADVILTQDPTYSLVSAVLLTLIMAVLIYSFVRFARANREEGAASAEVERMKTAQLTSQITKFDRPYSFRDSMVAGVFQRFDHDHEFESLGERTRVRDVFDFTSPLGLLGRVADVLVVTRHMRQFLERRMRDLKEIAESDAWSRYLPAAQPGAGDCDGHNGAHRAAPGRYTK